jgi:copper homeostasis protein
VPVLVEICVEGIASALVAGEGGADRIELCENLAIGGVTPSAGTIAVACRELPLPVHVLIRPRGGDFVYSDAEYEVMMRDVAGAKLSGASGVVLGLLDPAGAVDIGRTARLVEAARPMSVTFHRAFDEVRGPFRALEDLIDLGVERVLTSGRAARASEGLGLLDELNRRARGKLILLPGGRVGAEDLPRLAGIGLREVHVGSAACVGGRTDAEKVRRLVEIAQALP